VRERPSALLFLELLELPLGLFDQRCAADRGVELLDQLNDNPLFHPPLLVETVRMALFAPGRSRAASSERQLVMEATRKAGHRSKWRDECTVFPCRHGRWISSALIRKRRIRSCKTGDR
jgi:hypothetical protein